MGWRSSCRSERAGGDKRAGGGTCLLGRRVVRGLCRGGAGLKAWAQAGLLLSGHTLSHVALSPGARSSRGLGRLPETNLLWKELGTGIGQRSHLPADFCTWRDVCGGWGAMLLPPLDYVQCLRPGAGGGLGRVPCGAGGRNHSCSPPLSAGEPLPCWHVGLAVLPTRGAPPAPVRSVPAAASGLTGKSDGDQSSFHCAGLWGAGLAEGGLCPSGGMAVWGAAESARGQRIRKQRDLLPLKLQPPAALIPGHRVQPMLGTGRRGCLSGLRGARGTPPLAPSLPCRSRGRDA